MKFGLNRAQFYSILAFTVFVLTANVSFLLYISYLFTGCNLFTPWKKCQRKQLATCMWSKISWFSQDSCSMYGIWYLVLLWKK